MNERLKQFLSMENLSPARFAESLGIQRSGVSHLLSGRNKPSFEFIEKVLTVYPDLNPEWLILGKGRPYKSDRPVKETPISEDLFTDMPDEYTDLSEPLESDNQSFSPEIASSQVAENRKIEQIAEPPIAKTPKKIARIIVFFNDGTYEEK